MVQNFIGMSTCTDALRTSSFPQNWTIFYWAYWMVWCVATPFFIGTISKGRTIRQTVLGGYCFGLSGTFTSFIILGNYSLALQTKGHLDVMGIYAATGDLYQTIMAIFETLPLAKLGLILLAVTMIAFYATSFDALTMVASSYSYKELPSDAQPDKHVKLFWYTADAVPHCPHFLRELDGESSDRIHHCGIPHRNHYSVDTLQLL